MSFHATKVYNTFEGGFIVCHDEATKKQIDNLKNFGFVNETTVITPGINAKMNQIQAAMGLIQLKYIDGLIGKRKKSPNRIEILENIEGISYMEDTPDVKHCYSYFSVFIDKEESGKSRDEVYEELKRNNIYGRRYFYPLISQFPTYKSLDSAFQAKCRLQKELTEEVICFPFYPDLNTDQITNIL